MSDADPVRVVVGDDEPLVRKGIVAVLEKQGVVVCQSGSDPTTSYVARFPLSGGADKAEHVQRRSRGNDAGAAEQWRRHRRDRANGPQL